MITMFLDGIRVPQETFTVIARSSKEAIEYVKNNSCPNFISFDHDLGGEDTSMVFLKWLVSEDINKGNIIPHNFTFTIHSANPVGTKNIESYIKSYLKVR